MQNFSAPLPEIPKHKLYKLKHYVLLLSKSNNFEIIQNIKSKCEKAMCLKSMSLLPLINNLKKSTCIYSFNKTLPLQRNQNEKYLFRISIG